MNAAKIHSSSLDIEIRAEINLTTFKNNSLRSSFIAISSLVSSSTAGATDLLESFLLGFFFGGVGSGVGVVIASPSGGSYSSASSI